MFCYQLGEFPNPHLKNLATDWMNSAVDFVLANSLSDPQTWLPVGRRFAGRRFLCDTRSKSIQVGLPIQNNCAPLQNPGTHSAIQLRVDALVQIIHVNHALIWNRLGCEIDSKKIVMLGILGILPVLQ